jgi:hypothetical protein
MEGKPNCQMSAPVRYTKKHQHLVYIEIYEMGKNLQVTKKEVVLDGCDLRAVKMAQARTLLQYSRYHQSTSTWFKSSSLPHEFFNNKKKREMDNEQQQKRVVTHTCTIPLNITSFSFSLLLFTRRRRFF